MSSGNPMGLSEISHFGSFQRVGGKAGGFINKKFFHPSSIRNQEKLWQAQTADERERRKDMEMQKRRDEERQVEELRKQMYLAGQGQAGDFSSTAAEEKAATSHLSLDQKTEMKNAIEEQRKRKAMIKQQAALAAEAASPETGDDSDEDANEEATSASASNTDRKFAKSKYPEDSYINGHTTVWGSWYSAEDKQWGFKCCKLQQHDATCPVEPETTETTKKEPRGKRKRANKAAASTDQFDAAAGGESAGSAAKTEESEGVAAAAAAKRDPAELMDNRMFEAAAKRQKAKSFKEMKDQIKNQDQASGYLADLLNDPSAG